MKPLIQFLVTLTLCGCAVVNPGDTIAPAPPDPAVTQPCILMPSATTRMDRVTFWPDGRTPSVGCKPQAEPPEQSMGIAQIAPAPRATQMPLEPGRSLVVTHAKLPEGTAGTTPADSLAVPAGAGNAKLPGDPSEAFADPQANADNSISNATGSEADYESRGRQAKGQVNLIDVPSVNQQDYTSCGEAAFVMGWNYHHPDWVLDVGSVEATGLQLGVYFSALLPGAHNYLGTSPSGMEAVGDYYSDKYGLPEPTAGNIDLEKGEAYGRLEARGLLFDQLSAGNPVIIEVTDILGSPSKTANDSHYVIVTGMNFDTGRVTYNDPYIDLSMAGKVSGDSRLAEWSDLWASWSNNRDINPGEGGHPGRGWYMIVP